MVKRIIIISFLALASLFFTPTVSAKAAVAYDYQVISQSSYMDMLPCETQELWIEVKNTGTVAWTPGVVRLGTSMPMDRLSAFRADSWIATDRVVSFDSNYSVGGVVPPGYHTRFTFGVTAPLAPGSYREYFNLVADGYTWMKDLGVYWDINVVEEQQDQVVADPPASSDGEDWSAIIYPGVISINPTDGQDNVPVDVKVVLKLDTPAIDFDLSSELSPCGTMEDGILETGTDVILSREKPLLEDTDYTLNLYAEHKNHPGSKKLVFSSHFKTVPPPPPPPPLPPAPSDAVYAYQVPISYEVFLNVPQFYQLPLSCEATSLDMALAYHGKSPGLAVLNSQIGFDTAPIRKSGNNVISWGDPSIAFVGDIYGTQYINGYGVYWDPIARVGSLYGESRAFTGWSLSQILNEIQKGNPVIVWGSLTGRVDSWVTPAGKEVYAVHGEHARVIKGFKGTLENPSLIYINDPYYGPLAISASALLSFTSWFGNSGVVVY